MVKLEQEVELHFSQPIRQVLLMLSILALTSAGTVVAAPRVLAVFTANLWLNGFILFVFFVGVISCFVQVVQLIKSVRWIEEFVNKPDKGSAKAPQLLAPLATLLRSRGASIQISASSSQSILESVSTRVEEAREITRYIVNLLIFLGLLGTFYGLATTVPALVETIRSLAPQEGETGFEVFTRLMSGLEGQLSGMGVAFASSLLGLAGSLVVGLLELFAGQAQNRFYRELEEWLSTITSFNVTVDEGNSSTDNTILLGIFERLGDQIELMERFLNKDQSTMAPTDREFAILEDKFVKVMDENKSNLENLIGNFTKSQKQLLDFLKSKESVEVGIDAESRMRLRSIDVQMLHISEEIAVGRQEAIKAIREEIANLADSLQSTSAKSSDRKT
ncbi:MAG: biopolymer transporter ExbB [Paracoccaceae bacterium]|uniref:biopolymer transporter ExbB n=1 Tax=Candidatus Salinivivens marinus TaxID=3381703 RepID=UPI000BE05EF1|nr:MAG: biopolymer transporter ExbB [Rhodobacteraceae bacterium MED-G08]|tara:strand:+ start:142 stop:1314 length:1173 start_codon:yes stop_codon:yes gene_type:complete